MRKNIINIGILAHVDAGKTTIAESFLYKAGAIKSPGSVDNGTSQTDFLDIEKERGISVKSAVANLRWQNSNINLIDTPGHIDFSAEVERSIRVLDLAILVVSAVEGVQAHTENIWMALKQHNIPTIFFINKIDRIGADTEEVIQEIKQDLCSDIAVLQKAVDEGDAKANVLNCWKDTEIDENVLEIIANNDDEILESYISEADISFDELNNSLIKAVKGFKIFPVLMGVAKSQIGIEELLNAVVKYTPTSEINDENNLSAVVFRIDHDKKLGKIVGLRIFSGQISNKDEIFNSSQDKLEKVNQLKRYASGGYKDISIGFAGDVLALTGLNDAKLGDTLGKKSNFQKEVKLNSPLLTVQVKAINENDYAKLAEALRILDAEDPALQFEWLKEDKELNLQIMGWIQIEVLERVLENRFNVKAKFEDPTVIYKESPKNNAVGFARYWMPKPCWAIIKLQIEPGEPNSGLVYESKLSVDDVHRKYQNEVERTIPQALKQGPKGWEVTDLKITLIEGEDHEVHSRPGDFIVATPMAIMNGLINSGTKFLEPYIWFKITAPEGLLGAISSDIIQMRGSFESPDINDGKFSFEGFVPVATSMDFPIRLSSRSGGKAKIKTRFHSYKECSDEHGVHREYKGISPLDEAKYILKARRALQ
ncbi:MAG: TetM/TetW/TetO/TetS family tetracycline resistance ribosomal protection protein [Bacteroidetes bacterium]|nr:TetM/TetW/TetO/TetS family tetracycline resistance ribosomal protection protein [Bacteroidota bacterium]MBT6685147.1 TetM/TetW/TetO/TetS family tetracycline resistance ribosomal protection protein [Bacteroidota bacterium]MBT7142058.1 TetM/TetW/TetO/TetS family tetracycline resistance ribosomal protection protein [Bacteroidota bacterium]MBT7493380.1 TetM/TetW/TetO/TetS family tetracycline resistance ribosomal protection protein [Bacteroidota bacterium]